MSGATNVIAARSAERWRTIDIVVAAIVGVVFGVVFWFWGAYVWSGLDPVFQAVKPAEYIISGVWLMPAVVAPLIIRKPGAALFAELVAAIVSAILGGPWGLDVILSGFVQGAGAELIFAFGMYRSWGLIAAVLAGAAAAVGEAVHDIVIYYPSDQFGPQFQLAIAVVDVVSGVLIAGLGGWLLVRAVRRAGVLQSFPQPG
ncbi:MAG TPA: ECF transporter S component [Candidatus Limnocylindrales bacterium]|nr:ECF transporter S component [Candidatus Limnocylindrales bacterium]